MSLALAENLVTVAYTELVEGYSEKRSRSNGFGATRMLKCAWADRMELQFQLLYRGSSLYGWTTPALYPDNFLAFVTDVDVVPFKSTDSDGFENAKILVSYHTPVGDIVRHSRAYGPEQINSDIAEAATTSTEEEPIYCEMSISSGAEFLTLPYTKFFWDNAQAEPLSPDDAPGFMTFVEDIALDWFNLTTVPLSVFDLVGSVNTVALRFNAAIDYSIGSILYRGPQLRTMRSSKGSQLINLTLSFAWRPGLWNKFWDPNAEAFGSIYNGAGNAIEVYPTADLSPIWALNIA